MELRSIEGNSQRLDGGALFGNAPKALWSRWHESDDRNRIHTACRGLLVREDRGRTVLLETGIGTFFDPKMRDRFGVIESEHVLLRSLEREGLRPDDIDVIVLSHLHFDHAGGLLNSWRPDTPPSLAFPRAKVVVSRQAWERACDPHPRDRASFIPELPGLLQDAGGLEVLDGPRSDTLGEGYSFTLSEGHTPGLLLTTVDTPTGKIMFMGDLVPGVAWVHASITMGYDRFPERVIDEKRAVLPVLEREGTWMFFTHDPTVVAAKVGRDDKGRFTAVDQQHELRWGPAS